MSSLEPETSSDSRTAVPARADATSTHPLSHIGDEIKSLRKARSLSLQQLSAQCGKSIGYLSQLERNKSRPTVGALHDIAQALGVQISWFFPAATTPAAERGVVVRREHRRQLSFDSGVADFLLSPNLSGQLELLWTVMEPGADSGEAYSHHGEEGGVIIRGRMELWVGDESFELNEGDSFTFPSSTPHRYRNPGTVETQIVWAITPPSY